MFWKCFGKQNVFKLLFLVLGMAFEILTHIGLMIIVSAVFMYITHRLKQPLILGYILAGILLGPCVLNIITDQSEIIVLGELGVAFLLFSAGIEINLRNLVKMGVKPVIMGAVQILLCFVFGYMFSSILGLSQLISVTIGLLVALSSTMIATKYLLDKGEINSLHGRIIITLLLLQDVIAIGALLLVNDFGALGTDLINELITKVEILCGVVIGLAIILPSVLDYAAKNKTLFYITSLATLFLMLGVVTFLDFSLGIGAFLAGFILTNTYYKSSIRAEMKPLREFFAAIFFGSLGIQLNITVLLNYLPMFTGLIFLVAVVKPLLLIVLFLALGYGLRNALLVGMLLAQSSEFVFILAHTGLKANMFGPNIYSIVISTVVVTMLLTPYYYKLSKIIYRFAKKRLRKFRILFTKQHTSVHKPKKMNNHIIIVGAHRIGKDMVNIFKKKFDVICVEQDPEIIKDLKNEEMYHVYGDITNDEIINELELKKAQMIFLMIPNVDDQFFVMDEARKLNKKILIIARAHNKEDALELYKRGADYVIVPEYLSSATVEHLLNKLIKNKPERITLKKKHILEIEKKMY